MTKLVVKEVKSTQVHLRAQDFGGGKYSFRLQTAAGARINRMAAPIEAGENIVFSDELMKNRFKFVELKEKQMRKGGINQQVKFWVIEDLKPNKKGVTYEIDRQGNPGILDSTVEFALDAIGKGGETFKVEERTRFSLPFDANAKEKPYLLKVDRENKKIEIEYTDKDGNKKSESLNFK